MQKPDYDHHLVYLLEKNCNGSNVHRYHTLLSQYEHFHEIANEEGEFVYINGECINIYSEIERVEKEINNVIRKKNEINEFANR